MEVLQNHVFLIGFSIINMFKPSILKVPPHLWNTLFFFPCCAQALSEEPPNVPLQTCYTPPSRRVNRRGFLISHRKEATLQDGFISLLAKLRQLFCQVSFIMGIQVKPTPIS
jgi:hypothetical protein